MKEILHQLTVSLSHDSHDIYMGYIYVYISQLVQDFFSINGITEKFRYLKWRNPHRHVSCMDMAYVREIPSISQPKIRYSTSILGTWNFGETYDKRTGRFFSQMNMITQDAVRLHTPPKRIGFWVGVIHVPGYASIHRMTFVDKRRLLRLKSMGFILGTILNTNEGWSSFSKRWDIMFPKGYLLGCPKEVRINGLSPTYKWSVLGL